MIITEQSNQDTNSLVLFGLIWIPAIIIFCETFYAIVYKIFNRTVIKRAIFITVNALSTINIFIIVISTHETFPPVIIYLQLNAIFFLILLSSSLSGLCIAGIIGCSINYLRYKNNIITSEHIMKDTTSYDIVDEHKIVNRYKTFKNFILDYLNNYYIVRESRSKKYIFLKKERSISYVLIVLIKEGIFVFPYKKDTLLYSVDSMNEHEDLKWYLGNFYKLNETRILDKKRLDDLTSNFKNNFKFMTSMVILLQVVIASFFTFFSMAFLASLNVNLTPIGITIKDYLLSFGQRILDNTIEGVITAVLVVVILDFVKKYRKRN